MTPLPTDPAALLARARADDRVALARLLSYVERGGEAAMAVAELAYRSAVPYSVGLTGAPGAGKGTNPAFIAKAIGIIIDVLDPHAIVLGGGDIDLGF